MSSVVVPPEAPAPPPGPAEPGFEPVPDAGAAAPQQLLGTLGRPTPSSVARRSAEDGAPPIVSRLGHITLGLWFPAFRSLASRVPPEALAALSVRTVERAIWARRSVRQAVLANMAAVLERPPGDERVEAAAREMLAHHSRTWIDLLRYTGRPPADPTTLVARQEGTHHLLAARRGGRGAILLTGHVGNFELGGLFLRAVGLPVAVVYQPDPSPVVERHRARARDQIGVRSLPVTSPLAFVSVLRSLEENVFVAIQGDRDYAGTGLRLPFLGRSASFPVGPFKLAGASGAPVLPVFVLREPDGRYRTVVEEPIPVAHPRSHQAREEAEREALERFVSVLARTIRAHPTQWYCFTKFWEPLG